MSKTKRRPLRTVHYIFDTSGGIVNESLMRAKHDDHEKIAEHPQMRCFDGKGHLIELSLIEIPEALLPKLLKKREVNEFSFRHFIGNGENNPAEKPSDDASQSKKGRSKALVAAQKRLRHLRQKKSLRLAVVH